MWKLENLDSHNFFFGAIERVHFKARIYPNKYMAYDMPPDLKCLECFISPNLMRERERERERMLYEHKENKRENKKRKNTQILIDTKRCLVIVWP